MKRRYRSFGLRRLEDQALRAVASCAPVTRTSKISGLITKRREISKAKFAIPEERRFPIPDAYHAQLAITHLLRVAGRMRSQGILPAGTPHARATARKVLAAVRKNWPGVYACEKSTVDEVKDVYRL
jgi:hypothetical protein